MIKNLKKYLNQPLTELAWDLWCVCSIIGIWPRFIEPRLILTTHLSLKIPSLPDELQGLKILQFSDLHLNENLSDNFIKTLHRKVRDLNPDIIVFTGDFICGSQLSDPKRLSDLLNGFKAPYGCYAILGNHDYQEYVSPNAEGDYDVIEENQPILNKGWKRLFSPLRLSHRITERARQVPLHQELVDLIKASPFELLHNQKKIVSIKGKNLYLCGLGEYTLGQCKPASALKDYKENCPMIILSHNPDSLSLLKSYSADIVLCGHTHGGQVNLPILNDRFTLLENSKLKRGLHKVDEKWVYINRGLGSGMKFRWFSPPELLLLTVSPPFAQKNMDF